ncbi:hypothetical protein HID58_044723 [Brassica napus]|uniref:Uncharacterized protein n=1 Tax=Brassica napus TaxID=3708 RepID=A0ABQ8BK73_BRANA|nr:hypothetical protein HID58_044723 [Brassica napus]
MALKLNPLASQPYKLASSARLPISTFRSPKFLCLASSSSPALSSSTKSFVCSVMDLCSVDVSSIKGFALIWGLVITDGGHPLLFSVSCQCFFLESDYTIQMTTS